MDYYQEIISILKKKTLSKRQISALKLKLCSKHKVAKPPTDMDILMHVEEKDMPKLRKMLLSKPVRTLSGVAIVALMGMPIGCPHGKCTMCPGGPKSVFGDVPMSYTGKEPSTRRAIRNMFDPYLQVFNRLEQYAVLGHNFDKVDMIIMGGTFPFFPKRYQDNFVMYAFKAMNDFGKLFFDKDTFNYARFKEFFMLPGDINDKGRGDALRKKMLDMKGSSTLEKEHLRNEKSKVRCIGLTVETKPDYGKLEHGNQMLKLGCTKVEIGVQTIYDAVLKRINRGHTLKDTIESIQQMRDLGFKLNFHMMPGLPGVTPAKDLHSLRAMFEDDRFRPDMLKIYPCMVMPGTELYDDYKNNKFKPITTKQAAKLIAEFKQYVPEYCRIMRIQRDIPTYMTEAGVGRTNLRQYVEQEMKKKGIKCRCIRCREIGRAKKVPKTVAINTTHYTASKGTEFFISADAGDYLMGFCRMRFPHEFLRKEITEESSLIRELHVYGQAVAIGTEEKEKAQHKGIGSILLATAEEIASTYYKKKMVVISGVGVREYYRKRGYRKEGPYMVKSI